MTGITMTPDPEADQLLERDRWLRFALAMWSDGYRAASGDLDDVVLLAFADGWRCGLEAGAERGCTS